MHTKQANPGMFNYAMHCSYNHYFIALYVIDAA